jgi:hypothetical protein
MIAELKLGAGMNAAEPYLRRVVDQRGQPVVGAKVYVATGFQHLDLTNLAVTERPKAVSHDTFLRKVLLAKAVKLVEMVR